MAPPDIGQTVLLASVLAAALIPLALRFSRRWSIAIVASACLWLATVAVLSWTTAAPSSAKTLDLSLRPNIAKDEGYVSSNTCRACHPDQYESWHGSYHRSMTQVATPETVVGDFDDVSVNGYGMQYHLSTKDGEFFAQMDPRMSSPEPRKVVMTTGSHRLQYVWVDTPNKNHVELVQSAYFFEDKRWVPRESVFLLPPHGGGPRRDFWAANCIRCHSVGPQPGRYVGTKVGELGIACEACHGPGQGHVQCNGDPLRRYDLHLSEETDDTIVNPARLSPRRSSQICGFCHSHAFHSTPKLVSSGYVDSPFPDGGHAYRPGDELDDTVEIDSHERFPDRGVQLLGRFWPDGMVRGSGREYSDLVQSPCFQGGHEQHQMGCMSCHAMHKQADDPRSLEEWADDQLQPGMEGDQGCLQCHTMENIPQHTHHGAESSGSRCYNCHMPHTTYGLLKLERAHLNTNPSVQVTLDTGRANACNLCHLDKTLKWTANHLTEWYDQPTPELTDEQTSVAASILEGLKGRADQRVLIAWHMGWDPAIETSGKDWVAPYLGQLLQDPYDVIRFIAQRSLKKLPGYGELEYDWLGSEEHRAEATTRVRELWNDLIPADGRPPNSEVLFDDDGKILEDAFQRLLEQRNNGKIFIEE